MAALSIRQLAFAYLLCVSSFQHATAEDDRRLVVAGEAVDIQEYPFAAAILLCKAGATCLGKYNGSDFTGVYHACKCDVICSGSLVSSGAVLTAAHCLWEGDNRTAGRVGTLPLFVVLGVANVETAKRSSFFGVEKAVHAGWLSHHHEFDNDIALMFLDPLKCATTHSTVKLATKDNFGGGQACTNVTAVGWGRTATYVQGFYNSSSSQSPLKATHDFIHSAEVCKISYKKAQKDVEATFSFDPEGSTSDDSTGASVSPDRTLCFGGASRSGVCNGDSGGPLVARDGNRWVQLGVNGFVIGTCAVYADFGTRVAFYAEWVAEQLEAHDKCRTTSGGKVADAFATWPATPYPRSDIDKQSRCFVDKKTWACKESGKCIPWAKRCDGVKDCDDLSDEVVECNEEKWTPRCPEIDSAFKAVMDPSNASFWPIYNDLISLQSGVQFKQGLPPLKSVEKTVATKCKAWLDAVKVSLHSMDNTTKMAKLVHSEEFGILVEPCFDGGRGSSILSDGQRAYPAQSALSLLKLCLKCVTNDMFDTQRTLYVDNFKSDIQQCFKPKTAEATVTAPTVAEVEIAGAIQVSASNVTKEQMQTAVRATVAKHYGVPILKVTNVIAVESRRLHDVAARRLAGSWSISFKIMASPDKVASIETKTAALVTSKAVFSTALASELTKEGAKPVGLTVNTVTATRSAATQAPGGQTSASTEGVTTSSSAIPLTVVMAFASLAMSQAAQN